MTTRVRPKHPCMDCGEMCKVTALRCAACSHIARKGRPQTEAAKSAAWRGRWKAESPEDRFWTFVDKSGGPDACWPWMAGVSHSGYGYVNYQGARRNASRVAYGIANGGMPEGLLVCHTCDNPPCCNPAHLYAGTHADNARDMVARGRSSSVLKEFCLRGHDRTRRTRTGSCRDCRNHLKREARRARKALTPLERAA